jgi:polar amino acid transport system substrate-binding protein
MLLVALLAAFSLLAAACNDEEPEPVDDVDEPAVTTLTEGVLTIGSDIPFPPFEFRENGELMGYDVDLVEEIASRLGLTTDWIEADFDTIFTALAAEQFDMVASATTITEERAEIVNFSSPYFRDEQVLTVNVAETPDIQSTADLGEGDTVAVQRGTTGADWARENLEPQGVNVRAFPDAPDTYLALEAGNVTGVIFDFAASAEEVEVRENLEIVERLDTGEEYGFPINPANQELLAEVNRVLQEMLDDGTYQSIYDTWFPESPAGSVLAD